VLCEDSCTARQFWIKASELATRHQREFPWRPGVPDSFLAALRHIFVRDGFCEDGGAGYARSSTGEWNEIDRITRGKVLEGEWTSPVGLRSPWHDYLNSLYATRSHQDALVLWLWRPSSEMQQRYEQHLGTLCEYGTDCSDCGPRVVYPPPPPHPPGERVRCHDACPCHHDGQCDDQDSSSCILNGAPHACEFGSDCADCGPRLLHPSPAYSEATPPPPPPPPPSSSPQKSPFHLSPPYPHLAATANVQNDMERGGTPSLLTLLLLLVVALLATAVALLAVTVRRLPTAPYLLRHRAVELEPLAHHDSAI